MSKKIVSRPLDPEVKKLLHAAKVSKQLEGLIARLESQEDQLAIARALQKGERIRRSSLKSALSAKGSPGHSKGIIARCREIAEED